MFDVIALGNVVTETENENGFIDSKIEWGQVIAADFKGVTRSETLMASQLGYNADLVVEILSCNYADETKLRNESTKEIYTIKRVFCDNKKRCRTLTCEKD